MCGGARCAWTVRSGRRSSVMPSRGKGGALSKADPRPLNDKAYMASSSKTLIRFLSERGYARKVSLKTLQSPTSKDFFCMVEFLYRLIDPNYEMADKKPRRGDSRHLQVARLPVCDFEDGALRRRLAAHVAGAARRTHVARRADHLPGASRGGRGRGGRRAAGGERRKALLQLPVGGVRHVYGRRRRQHSAARRRA